MHVHTCIANNLRQNQAPFMMNWYNFHNPIVLYHICIHIHVSNLSRRPKVLGQVLPHSLRSVFSLLGSSWSADPPSAPPWLASMVATIWYLSIIGVLLSSSRQAVPFYTILLYLPLWPFCPKQLISVKHSPPISSDFFWPGPCVNCIQIYSNHKYRLHIVYVIY